MASGGDPNRPGGGRPRTRPRPAPASAPAPASGSATPAVAAAPAPAAVLLDLDRLIHEPCRLAIVSALAVAPALGFVELRQMLELTDGNLSVHARRLEEAGYVECRKTSGGRLPRTEFRLTAAGRRALARYLAHIEALVGAARP